MNHGLSQQPVRSRRSGWLAVAWLCMPGMTAVCAHEENSLVIRQLTEEISASPDEAGLYLRRAEMHRLIQHWHAAEADYRRAAHLAPGLTFVDLAAATMWNDAGRPEQALPLLDRFLVREPASSAGHSERARSKRMLKQYETAAADYAAALDHSTDPQPEMFADWADTLIDAGSPAQALAVLERGITRIGPVASLERKIVQLEISMGRYDSALTRVEALLARPGRKESILVIKAEILLAAGRHDEARACVDLARREFDSVPEARRLTAAGEKLAADLNRLVLRTVAASTSPNTDPSIK
jgi:tetratricopeptide (TPR) repeat protein